MVEHTSPSTETALLPCPFCGNSPKLSEHPMGIGNPRYSIDCDVCGITSGRDGAATAGIAIVRWNSRTPHAPAAAQKPGASAELSREWRCFHCDEVFTDPKAAANHFGVDHLGSEALCQMAQVDGGIAQVVADLAEELNRYRCEDNESFREFYRLGADHVVALGSEEEKGYARGLKDGQAFAKIPGNLFWMAAKGRLKSSEPLYAVQIIDPESGVHLTATEAETLEEAISASVSALVPPNNADTTQPAPPSTASGDAQAAGSSAELSRQALRLLAAEDERQSKLHEILETIREQIRTEVDPKHRPEGLFKNIQDAVYAMRGRTALLNDAAIVAAFDAQPSTATSGDAHG